MNAINSKCYILFYEKISSDSANNDYLQLPLSNFPPRASDGTTSPLHTPIRPRENIFPVTS